MKKRNAFDVLRIMNERDEANKTFDLALSTTVVSGRSDPRGAIIEMGVGEYILHDALSNKRRMKLLCIDQKAFDQVENEPLTGIELIAEERQQQIAKHGRTVDYDIEANCEGQLAQAASFLICEEWGCLEAEQVAEDHCPKGWNKDYFLGLLKRPYKERVTIAAAMSAAHLDILLTRGEDGAVFFTTVEAVIKMAVRNSLRGAGDFEDAELIKFKSYDEFALLIDHLGKDHAAAVEEADEVVRLKEDIELGVTFCFYVVPDGDNPKIGFDR